MTNGKPLVGITPLWDEERSSVWMIPEYLEAIRAAGGIPVVFPLKADKADIGQAVSAFDGVLLTGGPDVGTCPERDALESCVLDAALHADKPVLGICRGIQFLNVALGGTLWQDLPTEHPSEISHRQGKPYDRTTHSVTLSGPIRELMGKDGISVNSRHHQAVKTLSPGLSAMAFSPDGLVEAAYMPAKRFVWAVQWHPEYLYDKDSGSLSIFKALIQACKEGVSVSWNFANARL